MEYLNQPEIKEVYEKCKLIVKVWEHKFTKKYKRLPSKLDIREANRDVRNAYRKYFQLKTAALEQSFRDIEGFDDEESQSDMTDLDITQKSVSEQVGSPIKDPETIIKDDAVEKPLSPLQEKNDILVSQDVWGIHLNHKKKDDNNEKDKEKDNPNLSITKKLFCGSKFTKRNPRKSLSFSQKTKSNISVDDNKFLSQPITSNKIDYTLDIPPSQPIIPNNSFHSFDLDDTSTLSQNDWFNKEYFHANFSLESGQSKSINVIQSVLDNNYKPVKAVDTGWLQRVAYQSGVTVESQENIPSDNSPFRLVDNFGKPVYFQRTHSASVATQDSSTSNLCKEIEHTKLDYDSEDIIEESDDEMCSKDFTSLHVSKKRKVEPSPQNQTATYDSVSSHLQINSNISNFQENLHTHTETDNCMDVEDYEKIVHKSKLTEKDHDILIEAETVIDESNQGIESTIIKKTTKLGTRQKAVKIPRKPKATSAKKYKACLKLKTAKSTHITPRRSARQTRVKANMQEFSSGEEDPFRNDEEQDPEYNPDIEKVNNVEVYNLKSEDVHQTTEIAEETLSRKKITTKTSKKTPRSKKPMPKKVLPEESKEVEEDEQKTYDLEFSVKPRIVTPRYPNLKEVLTNNKIKTKGNVSKKMEEKEEIETMSFIKDKRQQAKDSLEQKIASGNLNDNFVRINLKKKVFVRAKSRKNFAKYKQWKSRQAKALCGPDMDMGGCDGGMLTCYNCGQTGHFARHCQAAKGDALLPQTAAIEEEECPFPTLEEASQMAQGALKIRVPKLLPTTGEESEDNIIKDGEEESIDFSEGENEDENCFNDDVDSDLLLLETMRLEEHVRKLDVQEYLDKVKVVEPYYQPNEDGSVIAAPPEVYEVLNRFGHTSFRIGQEQAVMRILSGKSTLVTLSTGSGKSLCYQLPAYMYSKREPCISLIISPLVSLMDDQIMGIAKFMKAACLHSNQTKTQRQKILDLISSGELSVLLVSPEAVVAGERQTGFGSFLRKLPPIAFACIDEAHCVSQWSHNFRPSYLMICRVLRESLGVRNILGLTATATRATKESIIQHLCISDGENGVISDVPLPDNLVLTVSRDAERDYALLRLLMSERFTDCKSIIVYCTRRDECERVASFLRTCLKSEQPVPSTDKKRKRVNLQAEPYHAGLSASRRRTIQNSFMSGMLRIVVATVAFGMGINKSDIRAVIHYNMPNSFESYVQEVGRAGRDGLPAHCHVFLDSLGRDENELRRHIHANSIERHVIRKLLQKVFIPCSCKGVCFKHEVSFSIESTVRALDIPEENISTLLCYLELHPNKYIELLSPAYTRCKIISYGGPLQIRKVAKDCPPLAMALALHKSKDGEDPNLLEFPVIEIASAMGWESGICKHKLKNLEWIAVNNQPKRSTISVQLSDLGFRMLAPGNLSEDQLDEALDSLYKRVVNQEQKAVLQLSAVHKTLQEVAKPSFVACSIEEDNCLLKKKVREYFDSSDPLSMYSIEEPKPINEGQLISDIHALISMYRDNNFTGRAIARIFHGIQSPNYPAVIWGRCKFWRNHFDTDFHTIVKIATKEIIKLR